MTRRQAERLRRRVGGTLRQMPGVFRRRTGFYIKRVWVLDIEDGSVLVE